jgi:hypothetical protein
MEMDEEEAEAESSYPKHMDEEEAEAAEAESSYPKHAKDLHTTNSDQRGGGSNDEQTKGSGTTTLGDKGSVHSRGNALTHGVVIKANRTQVGTKARLLFFSIKQTYVRMQTPTKHVQSSHSSQDTSKSDADASKSSNTNHKLASRSHQPLNAALPQPSHQASATTSKHLNLN